MTNQDAIFQHLQYINAVIHVVKHSANLVPEQAVHSHRTEKGGWGLRGEVIIAAFRPCRSNDICINRLQKKECLCPFLGTDTDQAEKSQTMNFRRNEM